MCSLLESARRAAVLALTAGAVWVSAPGRNRRPDVKALACMKNCGAEPTVASLLPDFARNSHGNLAEQNRTVGA